MQRHVVCSGAWEYIPPNLQERENITMALCSSLSGMIAAKWNHGNIWAAT